MVKFKSPLGNPEQIYVYVIDRKLIIDGGFCSPTHSLELHEYGVENCVITHHHIDHVGLVFFSDYRVMIHPREIGYIEIYSNPEKFIMAFSKLFASYGVGGRYEKTLEVLVSLNLKPKAKICNFSGLKDVRVVETPGHSPGHTAFLVDKCLFSGDLVLSDTTPNISFYPGYTSGVDDYLASLKKILEMEIDVVYPAHERIIKNPEKRVYQLMEHCKKRAEEIYLAVENTATLEEIASRVNWSIGCYRDFDDLNKFMALNETLAFLTYLERQGKIKRRIEDGVIKFTVC